MSAIENTLINQTGDILAAARKSNEVPVNFGASRYLSEIYGFCSQPALNLPSNV
jgi:hypothetical protein